MVTLEGGSTTCCVFLSLGGHDGDGLAVLRVAMAAHARTDQGLGLGQWWNLHPHLPHMSIVLRRQCVYHDGRGADRGAFIDS